MKFDNLFKEFIASFLTYLPTMIYAGISGHVDSFAKSAYDQKTMSTFNRLNTIWIM